jgi:hypothetical protein
MLRSVKCLVAASAALVVSTAPAVMASPTISVYPSIAPSATGSGSWAAYESNAMSALTGGITSAGTLGTPSYYSQVASGTNLPSGAYIVTNFNSWMGQANPGTVFGPAYANEVGTRVHYGVHIEGNGTKFSVSQLSFDLLYNDATYTDYSLFNVPAGSYDYTPGRVGLDYGIDNIKGTGDDIWVTSGSSSQLVDEFYSRGSSAGYEVLSSFPGATEQQKINDWQATNFGFDPYTFTGRYTLPTGTGAALVAFNTPEPASLALVSVGALAMMRRRRK